MVKLKVTLDNSDNESKQESKEDIQVADRESKTHITLKSKQRKRSRNETNEETALACRRMPKRAAACSVFKEEENCVLEEDSLLPVRRAPIVEDEVVAVSLTTVHNASSTEQSTTRHLSDFIFHDRDGKLQPVEMLELSDLYISGLVLPFERTADKEKGVRCNCFGRIESWTISGYEDGSPVIWISTDIANYICVKPATSYRKIFGLFYEKARACVEVYKKLSKSSGGNPDISLDELLGAVVRSMKGSRNFTAGASVRDFVISQGGFIYNQLIGLDERSGKNSMKFGSLPVLVALQNVTNLTNQNILSSCDIIPSKSLKIGDVEREDLSSMPPSLDEEDEDFKLARLLQEEENWRYMNTRKGKRQDISTKFYVMMNENEIATDYPLPAFYKPLQEETDEYSIFDDIGICDRDQLPRNMLHNWSLYNTDSRMVSLELLPMKPCPDMNVTIFGSGIVMEDDGSGFCLDANPSESSSSAATASVDGIPVYLSEIKEWMIEFGASMVFISIRTDLAWYRLGKPSKQYAPWYDVVLKTATLSINIITLLKEQNRVARLSVADVIKKVSQYEKDHPAFISSSPAAVERYVVVHGQIILQQFTEYPDHAVRRCAFVTGLRGKMEERHHSKWLVKKKVVTKKGMNLNPRASMVPVTKKKLLPATTTRLISRIWGEFYSNYSPEDSKNVLSSDLKEDDHDLEEDDEEDLECPQDDTPAVQTNKFRLGTKHKLHRLDQEIRWTGEPIESTQGDKKFYNQANIDEDLVVVGGCVIVETADSEEPPIYLVEYMFEKSGGRKMFHGRLMLRGCQTVLGNAANDRELFLTNNCLDFDLHQAKQTVVVEIRSIPWGYQHRSDNANRDKLDRARAEDRKSKGLALEYFCKSLYYPEKGAFFSLPSDIKEAASGICLACNVKKTQMQNELPQINASSTGFVYKGTKYNALDFVYVSPRYFAEAERDSGTFKGGRNVGLKPYTICQLVEIKMPKGSGKVTPESVKCRARRFFRPDDISANKAYRSDIREVYISEKMHVLTLAAIQGKCEVIRMHELQSLGYPAIYEHTFFCEHLYYPDNGAIKQLPCNLKLSSLNGRLPDGSLCKTNKGKGKGKMKEGDQNIIQHNDEGVKNQLATLDIFAGCGGLSEGLQQSGVSLTKWAIEYDEAAGEAFSQNHPEAKVFINNCNVILRAIMSVCGDDDDCMSTPETSDLAEKLDAEEISKLPLPGQVDFINGGPPCQGFSGMNRFNKSTWSKVQCEMILGFLSFADYFRPKYFLLENVRNFVSFNKGQTFRLTLASLLEMGYQVRFGVLEAGAFGISQSRKRAFIWAASPQETLPEWPEPMHVFAGPELKITLDRSHQYAAVRSTASGAPFRSITVRDTIDDLPAVGNGATITTMEYKNNPASWYQKMIRGNMITLTDHISKEMNELNLVRCQKIPKHPGADWRDLPEEKVRLSTGLMADLIPWCLPNTAERHNQWKGLFGRLDWEGNFPTSITDPQPMGKVGMCFHPEQDRIVTVRECARSQGFSDSYKFAGTIQHKHRQIGNAVPPPLAFALGRMLKEAIAKHSA